MAGLLNKLRGVFKSPSRKSKSHDNLNNLVGGAGNNRAGGGGGSMTSRSQSGTLASSQILYTVKEKDLNKLQSASWKGDINKVKELSKPDKINLVDKEGRTPLLLAIANNHFNIVQHLLNEGAKLQVFDKFNRSPFILAVLVGDPRMVQLLLHHLDNKNLVNIPDRSGKTPLIYAIKNENMPILEIFVKEQYLNLDQPDKDKNTALHHSVIQQKPELIDILIENGADIDVQNGDGRTPLMLAVIANDENLVDYILDYGADKNIRDNTGSTALEIAESCGSAKCADLIRENRPVKANSSKTLRDKQRNPGAGLGRQDTNERSEAGPSYSERKKFENIFSGNAARNNDDDDDDDDGHRRRGEQNDTEDEADTSKIIDDEKNVLSHQKSERINSWASSSESLSDHDEPPVAKNQTLANLVGSKKKSNADTNFDAIFGHSKSLDLESPQNQKGVTDANMLDLNINQDDNNWLFSGTSRSQIIGDERKNSNSSSHVVLSTFLPESVQKKANDESGNWSIYVYTSDLNDAGTDANVHMQIYGTKSSTAKLSLDVMDKKENKKLFERGQCDKFSKQLPDIGKPTKIKIGHDNTGLFSGWHLDKVLLQNNVTNEKFVFPCNRWLADDELDQKIELELIPQNATNNQNQLNKKIESSVSSWTSSDEESSLSVSKKSNASPVKTHVLKQIDEEKLNETFGSRKSNENKMKINAPPEISDLEDNSIEDQIRNLTSPRTSDFIGKLVPKQVSNQQSDSMVGQLVKTTMSGTTRQASGGDFSDSDEKTQSIDDLINQFEQVKGNQSQPGPSKSITNSKQNSIDSQNGLKDGIRQMVRTDSKSSNEVMGLGDLIRLEKSKLENSSQSSILSGGGNLPNGSVKGLNELMRAERQNALKNQSQHSLNTSQSNIVRVDDSPAHNGVLGLVDLMRQEKANFLNHSSQNQSTHSINNLNLSGLSNNNNNNNRDDQTLTLAEMMRNEKVNLINGQRTSSTPLSASPTLGLADLMRQEKASVQANKGQMPPPGPVSTQNTTPGLAELMRNEKQNIENNRLNESQPAAVPGLVELMRNEKQNMDNNRLNESVFINMPPPGFRNTDPNSSLNNNNNHNNSIHNNNSNQNDSFILHSMAPTAGSVANLMQPTGVVPDSNHKYDSASIDSLTLNERIGGVKALVNASAKVTNFNSDSESESLFDVTGSKSPQPKQQSPVKQGTIDHGVGTFMSNLSPFASPQTSPSKAAKNSSSFVDIMPEMFSSSFARPKSNNEQTAEFLDKLKDKTDRLERDKSTLEEQLRKTEQEKMRYEVSYKNLDKMLTEKDELIMRLREEKLRTDTNEMRQLQKEIHDLKDDKQLLEQKLTILQTTSAMAAAATNAASNSLRSSEDLTTPLVNQIDSLNIRIKALEYQLDELNKDRKTLSAHKIDLEQKIEENEMEIRKQSDALQLVTLQFNVEKKSLNEDLAKSKRDLNELTELRKKLQVEIDSLKQQLHEKTLSYEKLSYERQNYERLLMREKDDSEKMKKTYETQMNQLQEQLNRLGEKLKSAELQLVSTEKEARFTKDNIDERERQIDELKNQLAESKSELLLQINLSKREKEEKENLIKRIEQMEEIIKRNMEQLSQLTQSVSQRNDHSTQVSRDFDRVIYVNGQMQQQTPQSSTASSFQQGSQMPPQPPPMMTRGFDAPNSAASSVNYVDPRLSMVENENKKLQSDVKDLNDKLQKTESELVRLKKTSSRNRHNDVESSDADSKTDSKSVRRSNDKLKMEIQKLRDDYNTIMTKYSNLETSNNELNASLNSLKVQALNGGVGGVSATSGLHNEPYVRREPVALASLIAESGLKSAYPHMDHFKPDDAYQTHAFAHVRPQQENINPTDIAEIKTSLNMLKQQYNNNNTIGHHDSLSVSPRMYCPKCTKQSNGYLDLLKYELGKRIEVQVAQELSNNNVDYASRKFYNSGRVLDNSSFDSLYSTMSSRYTTSNSSDLLNSLRAKFLI